MIGEWNRITLKSLCCWIERAERLRAPNPQGAKPVSEEYTYRYAVKAVWVFRILSKDLEGIAIVTVESISCSKPNKAFVVLRNVICFYL